MSIAGDVVQRRPPAAVTRNETGSNMSDVQHARPRTPAERMRRSRDLRRKGLRVVPVEVRDTEVQGLVRLGLLPAGEQDNPAAIGDALGRLLDRISALRGMP
jgi:hypothetical protein